ncbi:MAG: metallopeptidase family protein [Chloroflexota bacterium]|nr:metallopeptidase family protein [Chloroflexota bacterium]
MYRLSRRQFQRLALQAFKSLPQRFRDRLENIALVVESRPPRKRGDSSPPILGLYEGVPLAQREGGYPLLPDKITFYQRPIEEMCHSFEEVQEEIRRTLLHEVGHYFGLEEDELADL